ncbi:MAG TPA: MarR family transcriptional regulator [Tepidisphaeraceae bacterium]|nr:MarR family transcriptional regulator [Tepidisphaeraceae bacterium]
MSVTKARSQARSEKPVEPAYRALIRTMGLLRRVMEPYFAKYGISASQWSVLRALNRAEQEDRLKGIRLTDLSDRLLVRPPSVTGTVDRLERTGLVSRAASRTDQRAKMVRLTFTGRQLVHRVRASHAARVQSVLAALRRDEQRQLHYLLDRLGDHLEELNDSANSRAHHNGHK